MGMINSTYERLKGYIERLKSFGPGLKEKGNAGTLPSRLKAAQLAINYFSIFLNPHWEQVSDEYILSMQDLSKGREIFVRHVREKYKKSFSSDERALKEFTEGSRLEEAVFKEFFPKADSESRTS